MRMKARPARDFLSSRDVAALQAELGARRRRTSQLRRQRQAIRVQINQIDRQIMKLGAGLLETRKRPRNKQALRDLLVKILTGKTMTAIEAARAAAAAGHVTSSVKFVAVVRGALLDTQRFRRVARGLYTAV